MSGVLPKANFAASSVPGGVHTDSGIVFSPTLASRSGTRANSPTSTVTR